MLAQPSRPVGRHCKFPMSSHMYINMFMFLLLKHASAKSLVTLVTSSRPAKTHVFAKCGFAQVKPKFESEFLYFRFFKRLRKTFVFYIFVVCRCVLLQRVTKSHKQSFKFRFRCGVGCSVCFYFFFKTPTGTPKPQKSQFFYTKQMLFDFRSLPLELRLGTQK